MSIDKTVFFSNVPYTTTVGYLRKTFSKVGKVQDVELYTDSYGSSIGAGVVTFDSSDAAQKAVTELNDTDLDGRKIAVKLNERESRYGKGGSTGDPQARVFFNGIPFETTEGYLRSRFERHGKVVDFDFWRRPDGYSQGMGTCCFSSRDEAEAALLALNGTLLDGRRILVQMDSKPEPGEKPATGSGKGSGKKGSSKGAIGSPPPWLYKGGFKGAGKGRRVFWSNVPAETTEGYLRAQFERFGTITDFDFWRKPETGVSQGKGTCEFDHFYGAWRTMEQLHGQLIDGRRILIKEDDGRSGLASWSPGWGKGMQGFKGKGWLWY